MKYYAGIGSRTTPFDIYDQMVLLAHNLETLGYCLRSGGAEGADTAFASGCDEKEIFLPWQRYNNHPSPLFNIPAEAFTIAEELYHKNRWSSVSDGVKRLMARNVQQILGRNLDQPANFVVCWTRDGCESAATRHRRTGGTGQAIAVATKFDIPVVNMYNDNWRIKLDTILEDL